MEMAFEKFKHEDLDVRIVWYAPPIDDRFEQLAARFPPQRASKTTAAKAKGAIADGSAANAHKAKGGGAASPEAAEVLTST